MDQPQAGRFSAGLTALRQQKKCRKCNKLSCKRKRAFYLSLIPIHEVNERRRKTFIAFVLLLLLRAARFIDWFNWARGEENAFRRNTGARFLYLCKCRRWHAPRRKLTFYVNWNCVIVAVGHSCVCETRTARHMRCVHAPHRANNRFDVEWRTTNWRVWENCPQSTGDYAAANTRRSQMNSGFSRARRTPKPTWTNRHLEMRLPE